MSYDSTNAKERGTGTYTLFEFVLGDNVSYKYTDADEDVFWQEERYVAAPLTFSDLVEDGTLKNTELKLESDKNLKPAKIFRVRPPSYVTTVVIHESQFADEQQEVRKIWEGRVINCRIAEAKATFTCQPLSVSLQRPGLHRHYQKPCPLPLYGSLCKANKFFRFGTLSAVDQNVVRVIFDPGSGPEQYAGGLFAWSDGENVRFQTILKCEAEPGNVFAITLNYRFKSASEIGFPRIQKGCNHTEDACQNWHDNIQNYGGCPFIPDDVPTNKFSTFY